MKQGKENYLKKMEIRERESKRNVKTGERSHRKQALVTFIFHTVMAQQPEQHD